MSQPRWGHDAYDESTPGHSFRGERSSGRRGVGRGRASRRQGSQSPSVCRNKQGEHDDRLSSSSAWQETSPKPCSPCEQRRDNSTWDDSDSPSQRLHSKPPAYSKRRVESNASSPSLCEKDGVSSSKPSRPRPGSAGDERSKTKERMRARRPDAQIYVPRARRQPAEETGPQTETGSQSADERSPATAQRPTSERPSSAGRRSRTSEEKVLVSKHDARRSGSADECECLEGVDAQPNDSLDDDHRKSKRRKERRNRSSSKESNRSSSRNSKDKSRRSRSNSKNGERKATHKTKRYKEETENSCTDSAADANVYQSQSSRESPPVDEGENIPMDVEEGEIWEPSESTVATEAFNNSENGAVSEESNNVVSSTTIELDYSNCAGVVPRGEPDGSNSPDGSTLSPVSTDLEVNMTPEADSTVSCSVIDERVPRSDNSGMEATAADVDIEMEPGSQNLQIINTESESSSIECNTALDILDKNQESTSSSSVSSVSAVTTTAATATTTTTTTTTTTIKTTKIGEVQETDSDAEFVLAQDWDGGPENEQTVSTSKDELPLGVTNICDDRTDSTSEGWTYVEGSQSQQTDTSELREKSDEQDTVTTSETQMDVGEVNTAGTATAVESSSVPSLASVDNVGMPTNEDQSDCASVPLNDQSEKGMDVATVAADDDESKTVLVPADGQSDSFEPDSSCSQSKPLNVLAGSTQQFDKTASVVLKEEEQAQVPNEQKEIVKNEPSGSVVDSGSVPSKSEDEENCSPTNAGNQDAPQNDLTDETVRRETLDTDEATAAIDNDSVPRQDTDTKATSKSPGKKDKSGKKHKREKKEKGDKEEKKHRKKKDKHKAASKGAELGEAESGGTTSTTEKDEGDVGEVVKAAARETEDADSWDALFDDNGDALKDDMVEELTAAVGKVSVQKTQFDYYNFQPRDIELDDDGDYGHLIEIYDFCPDLLTRDLIVAFREFQDKGFDIKWVDDTHAIGVFSSTVAARSALSLCHPLMKVRPISQATRQTKLKARRSTEFLQPYKPRPETNTLVARNLVAGALGLGSGVNREKRNEERRKLKAARDKKKEATKLKRDAWEGSIGRCAMDEET